MVLIPNVDTFNVDIFPILKMAVEPVKDDSTTA
jgi:hypothetical protein